SAVARAQPVDGPFLLRPVAISPVPLARSYRRPGVQLLLPNGESLLRPVSAAIPLQVALSPGCRPTAEEAEAQPENQQPGVALRLFQVRSGEQLELEKVATSHSARLLRSREVELCWLPANCAVLQ